MNKKKIALGILVFFLVIQVFQTDKTPPPTNVEDIFSKQLNVPEPVLAQFKTSCYDCHSHETKYPWYTYVAPVSFWIKGHIKNGRKKLNFSTWATLSAEDQKHVLRECIEEIEDGHMPPKGYYRMHDGAYLDDAKKALLTDWLQQQL